MPKLNVKITQADDVTEVEYNGAKYAKVDREAQVGDLIRITSVEDEDYSEFIEVGGFYEVDEVDDFGDPQIFDDMDGDYDTADDKYEVFAKVRECCGNSTAENDGEVGKRLKVGDLVRYTKSQQGFEGDIARIKSVGNLNARDVETGNIQKVPYYTERLADGKTYGTPVEWCEPYTPTAGDTLEINGTSYTLRDRKAEVGEKVLVIAKNSGHTLSIGDIKECVGIYALNGDFISTGQGQGYLRYSTGEYLVLEPKPAIEWADGAKEQAEAVPEFKVGDNVRYIGDEWFDNGTVVKITEIDVDAMDHMPWQVTDGKHTLWVSADEIEPVVTATTTFEIATKAGGIHVIREDGEVYADDIVLLHKTVINGKAYFAHPAVFIPFDDIESISRRAGE